MAVILTKYIKGAHDISIVTTYLRTYIYLAMWYAYSFCSHATHQYLDFYSDLRTMY